ncbi:MAG: pur operon repressor [Firmicutes bacterium]|nr:pur operon repressor [Bacillota bacterium]
MDKLRRSERIVIMTKILLNQPRTIFSLNYFAQQFQAAKSTISEDLAIIRQTFDENQLGQIETIPGAAGGVRYVPRQDSARTEEWLLELVQKLSKPDRILPGGFLYMTDIIFDPQIAGQLGEIFATRFADLDPDFIVTIETKGIPLALMTARAFNVPLIIVRADSRVTEGPSVSINYVSGSSRRIQSMSLPRRAMPAGARVIIIDDFMKAGGTARGMQELMDEFRAEVLGMGFFMETASPPDKLVANYLALLRLEKLDEVKREILIRPVK